MSKIALASFLALSLTSSAFAKSVDKGLDFLSFSPCADEPAPKAAISPELIGTFVDPVLKTKVVVTRQGVVLVDHDEEAECQAYAVEAVDEYNATHSTQIERESSIQIIQRNCITLPRDGLHEPDSQMMESFEANNYCRFVKVASNGLQAQTIVKIPNRDYNTRSLYSVRLKDGRVQYAREMLSRWGFLHMNSTGFKEPWVDLVRASR